MKTQLLYLAIILLMNEISAQTNLKDNDAFCMQYSKIIEFISNDSIAIKEFSVNKMSFKIDNKIRYGIGNSFMNKFYIAQTLGIETSKGLQNDSASRALFNKLEIEESKNSHKIVTSSCLSALQKEKSQFNVSLQFERKNEKVVFVDSSRIYDHPRHSHGICYLFFFDNENNIVKTYSEDWIE